MLAMDVTRDEEVTRAVDEVVRAESRVDVLVNNAGYGIAGPIEETSDAEAQAQFDTNFFGPIRVVRAVLPHMRRQGSGLIVNMSSIAGLVPVPFQGLYSASKAALESLSEALRMEVHPYGIRVALLEPGDFRTGFTGQRVRVARATADSPYHERFERALAVMERDEGAAPPPTAVAQRLEAVLRSGAPALRYPIANTLQLAAPKLRQVLPHWLYERLLMQNYNVFP